MEKQQKAYILIPDDKNGVQKASAASCKSLASIIQTAIGPRAMQKLILTKIQSIEITNDGNTILREMDVSHPSARVLIELSRTQDDECGDGTTSVLILAAELLSKTVGLLDKHHPLKVCKALAKAKEICLNHLNKIALDSNDKVMLKMVENSVETKICSILKLPIPQMALEAVKTIKKGNIVDVKNNIKIEKIVGNFDESEIIKGYIVMKDIMHPRMRKEIDNPRILLLDSPIEYRKGESVTNISITDKSGMNEALKIEEAQIREMCDKIMDLKPDVVCTEKGICDLALGIFQENNITALRRFKKSELSRLAKATGAILMNSFEELSEKHIGIAGKFENYKIGNDSYCKFTECENPESISVILRGPSRDILNEIERNFMDAIKVARNVISDPKLVYGGGCCEMSLSVCLNKEGGSNIERDVYQACAKSFKIIPSILFSNSGVDDTVEMIEMLEQKHSKANYYGIDGVTGEIIDVRGNILDPILVKKQIIKSSFDAVTQLLRVDGIIEGKTNE